MFRFTPILLSVSTLFAAFALAASEKKTLENFKPDVSTSDIYLGHQRRFHLGGWWKLKRIDTKRKNTQDKPEASEYLKPQYSDADWEKDLVPNNLNTPYLKTEYSHAEKSHGGVVFFRKDFTFPKLAKGERAILYFEDVVGAFKVWVNGGLVFDEAQRHPNKYSAYRGPLEPFSADVTKYLATGKNLLAVRLFHSGKPVFPWGGQLNGIMGRVYLDIKPAAWTDRILVTTRRDLKTVDFDCILSGETDSAKNWKGEIFEWKSGEKVAIFPFGNVSRKFDLPVVSGTVRLKNPKLWFTESPFLYGIRILDASGKVAGVQRFGVRTFGIEKGNFVLNNIPVMLKGRCFAENELYTERHGYVYAHVMNASNISKKFFKSAFRDMNMNWIRLNTYRLRQSEYDVADELGLFVTDELSYPSKMIENAQREDEIFVRTWDTACDLNGNLLPKFANDLKKRIFLTYSHPSLCTYSFGNEIRDFGRVNRMMNNIFDLYRRYDAQKRPVTSSSGRVYKEGSNMDRIVGEKFDYIDTHDYSGTGNETPLPYCGISIRTFVDTVYRFFGRDRYPIINGECIYDGNRYWRNWYDVIWKNENDPQPVWDKYLRCVNEMKKKERGAADLSLYWIRIRGTKNYKYHRSEGYGLYNELVLEYQRAAWPEMDGFAALVTPFYKFPSSMPDFSKVEFEPLPAFYSMKRVNSPLFGYLNYIAPNHFSGTEIETNAYVVNNHETARDGVKMLVTVTSNGKKIVEKMLDFGTLVPGGKASKSLSLKLPETEGVCNLEYRVVSSKGTECERNLSLRLRNSEKLYEKIPLNSKKIGLFDASSAFGSLKPYSTIRVLKKFGIPYKTIEKESDLSGLSLVIVGNNSAGDPALDKLGRAIRKYVENGGRLLVFDQEFSGRYPFLPELSCAVAGPGQFSEIVRFDHPVMRGVSQNDLFLWNSKDQCIYRNYILPLSKASIASGGNCAAWGVDRFGMIFAHLKLGKGDVMLTQAEVTKNFRKEPAAALICRNMIQTMLDETSRKSASEFTGLPPVSVRKIDDGNAVFLSLASSANMAFRDAKARDGKGGWTDQGPDQDFSAFPSGLRRFSGTLFRILDPARNGNRSCIVVSAQKGLPFKPESTPVAVHKKLARIIFLYSGAWIGGKEVGEFVVRYKSGMLERVILRSGENIADWLGVAPLLSRADCAWTGMNKVGIINAYAFDWKNPRTFDEIVSVTVRSIGDKPVICLLGMTGEKIK